MFGGSIEPERYDSRSDKPPLVAGGLGAIPPGRLPAGRHGTDGLDPETVASIQRKRLRRALVAAAAQRSCDAITVETVCGLAGVSRRTLYDRFDGGVPACLHSTCHTVLNATARQISQALHHRGQWPDQLLRFVTALTGSIGENPDAARLVLINAYDMPTASIPPIVCGTELLEDQLKACFTDVPPRQTPPPLVIKGVVLGMFHVARTHLLAGREQDLPPQAPVLAEWARRTCALQSEKPPHSHTSAAPKRPGRTWWTAAFAEEASQSGGEERAALLDACARLVCEHGLARLQPRHVSAAAGLRRGALHTHFTDPSECLLAAYQRLVGAALSEALENAVETADYSQSAIVHDVVDDLIATLNDDSYFAKLAFCEILTVGAAAVSAQTRLLDDFAAAICSELPLPRQPEIVLRAGVGALWAAAGHLVASGQTHRLPEERGMLQRLLLPSPADDPSPARGFAMPTPSGNSARRSTPSAGWPR